MTKEGFVVHGVHSYSTRSVTKEGFVVPGVHSTSYGIKTLKYSVSVIWNSFALSNPELCEIKHSSQLKRFLKDHFISQYTLYDVA